MTVSLNRIPDEPIKDSRAKIDDNFQTIENVLNTYTENAFEAGAYGALFDGVTDDTAAIQAAIDAANAAGGGVVSLPAGTAIISSPLVLYSNIFIFGQGKEATILKTSVSSGALPGGAIINSGGLDIDNIILARFKVLGHGEAQTSGSGIYIYAASGARNNMLFDNLHIQDFPEYGLYVRTPILVNITNCRIRNAGLDGIFLENGTSAVLSNTYTTGGNRSGVHLKGFTYSVLNGCASEYNTFQYWLESCTTITLNGCGSEVAMRADGGAAGIVCHYRIQSCKCIVVNNSYTAQFAYLHGIPAYHWYITGSTKVIMNGVRGTANLLAPNGEQHEAPANTIYISSGGEVFLNNVSMEGEVGGGISGTAKSVLDSTGYFILQSYLSAKGFLQAYATKTADYTLTATDFSVDADATAGDITLTLPAAASHTGRIYLIRKTDSSVHTVTVDGNGSETINGALTRALSYQYESMIIQSDGTNWQVTNVNDKRFVGLGNVDNTSDANKPVSTAQQTALDGKLDDSQLDTDNTLSADSDTKIASQKAIKAYVDGKVLGLLDYRGAYDASGNTFPASGGSGTAGAILKGDMFVISVAGTLGGVDIQVGDSIIANVDTPGQTAGNWDKLNTNISYVPEDSANKDTDGTLAANSDTKYASQKAVKTYVDTGLGTKQDSDSDLTAIAGLSPSNDDILQRKSGAWTNRTMAQLKADLWLTIVSKTYSDTPYSVGATDEMILVNASGGAVTVNLPAAASNTGRKLKIKKTDSSVNLVTIDGNSSETIDGDLTLDIVSQYDCYSLVCDGSNWHII